MFLFGGCLTLGVLGSARCLLDPDRGQRSVEYLTNLIGQNDFVLVTEARRVGGLIDVTDLSTAEPLLVLTRTANNPFTAIVDNTSRYPATRRSRHDQSIRPAVLRRQPPASPRSTSLDPAHVAS